MERPSTKSKWKTTIVLSAIGLVAGVAAGGGCLYYYLRLCDVPPPAVRPRQAVHAVAGIIMARQAPAPSAGAATAPSSPSSNQPERPRFHVEGDPLDDFREDLKNVVVAELGAAFPELQDALDEQKEGNESSRERLFFRLLEASKNAPSDRRPAMLFAADLVGSRVGCQYQPGFEQAKANCAGLEHELASYGLSLKNDELGAGLYYPRDLLWRIWADYPETEWGERAFVLLLDRGWDTSATCEKGEDQIRPVIREGESFLQQRPSSRYRGLVTFLVAEAYASWWSLSNEPPGSDMADYVDPKKFQDGSEAARVKAIANFEEVARLSPKTKLSDFALQVLPALRDRQVLDNYRFLCVND